MTTDDSRPIPREMTAVQKENLLLLLDALRGTGLGGAEISHAAYEAHLAWEAETKSAGVNLVARLEALRIRQRR